jgi:RNA-directed DNA polymerase
MRPGNSGGAKGAQGCGDVTEVTTGEKPAVVFEGAKQAGETRARRVWVEPSVWTERMLAALERGVKGGKWFSLIDKVNAKENLRAGFAKVKANRGGAGADHVTIERYEVRLEENLDKLSEELRAGSYSPQAIKRHWIPKAGSSELRPLGIPTVNDRVAQAAILNVVEPIFEREFSERSYGFRPNRGCKDALRRVDELLKQGYTWVVDADLESYFDTIPHTELMKRVEEKISDGAVLKLIEGYLKQEIMDGMKRWRPEVGSPQGAIISPLLSNIYLNSLDHEMRRKGKEMVRYADDIVIMSRSREGAEEALAEMREWVEESGLRLHPEKTRIVDAKERGGFDFLGYHFERQMRWPRSKSLKKFKDTIREKTKRTNGDSLTRIITSVNVTARGWFEYFKHSHYTTFGSLDGWIRMRLRSILRKRSGLRGRGRGRDHQRWTNAYFARQGLFSLVTAHVAACQSCNR